jgi:putative ABC transport system substrate-binding protein
MRRRTFISLLGGAAAWPLAARGQQPAMPVVGFPCYASADAFTQRLHAFRQGLGESGYVEGENVAIEFRWADGRYDRLPALAADLVRRRVTAIAAISDSAARAAKGATATIPIVFTVGSDPVKQGLVASLNRPGGNLTGVTNLNVELGQKRVELLHQVIPTASIIFLLVNPAGINMESVLRDAQAAAHTLGFQINIVHASTATEIDAAFASMARQQARALAIGADAFFNNRSEQLAALALRHALPAIFQFRDFAAAGGLMSYGGSLLELTRQVGVYTGRVLKGAKPADLPVQQSTKAELVINLRTAKTLGIEVPPMLLARADEVIE